MSKYHNDTQLKDPYLHFKLLDKDGNLIRDFSPAGCYGGIISTMDNRAAAVHVYRKVAFMPYEVPSIKRWIADLNEMGFPCTFAHNETDISDERKQYDWARDTTCSAALAGMSLNIIRHGQGAPKDTKAEYNFFVYFKDYEDKSHLFSTLTLVRNLWEYSGSTVPEIYFEMLDKDPRLDKFQALQDANKKVEGYSHAVTHRDNGPNVPSLESFMKRFKQTKTPIHSGRLGIHAAWNGNNHATA